MRYLQERERFTWDGVTVQEESAADAEVASLQHQREGDPYAFSRVLHEVYDDYWTRYAEEGYKIGVELSGGLDSAIAPAYFSHTGRNVSTALTMLYQGAYGVSQRQKVIDFTERFDIPSLTYTLDPQYDYPLSRFITSGQWHPIFHYQEIFTEPREHLIRLFASEGGDVIFHGTGGNELSDNVPFHSYYIVGEAAVRVMRATARPSFLGKFFEDYYRLAEEVVLHTRQKAVPPVSATVTIASESANNLFIEQGTWPVAPLADPRLYYYCQSLPIRYRANRNIMRAYLGARGIPESIYNPVVSEDFTPFLVESMVHALPLFQELLAQSVLQRYGLIDLNKLWPLLGAGIPEEMRNASFRSLYDIVVIEVTLRSLGKHSL